MGVSENESEADDQNLVCWESEGKGSSFYIVGLKICRSYWSREDEIESDEVCDTGDVTDFNYGGVYKDIEVWDFLYTKLL